MPEDIQAIRKKKFNPVRVARITQLAKDWNVPTQNIFSTVYWGYDQAMDVPDRTDYFTLDSLGNVKYQKIDYGPVKGWPAGVYSPKSKPLPTADPSQLIPGMGHIKELHPSQKGQQPTLRKGGRIARKAANGDILPVGRSRRISTDLENPIPSEPFAVKDMSIANFFNSPHSRRLIPNDASLNGPQPGQVQSYIDAETGDLYQDSENDPVPINQTGASTGMGVSTRINPGAIITGVNSAFNAMYDRNQGIKEFTRLKRKQLQDGGYNPFTYGTGSGALLRNGGSITPMDQYGASGSPMYEFEGPSHEQGGIPISFQGKKVEVEGGETAYRDGTGALNIFGNLKLPGTNLKFKTAGKHIGKLEAALSKKLTRAQALMQTNNPQDKFEGLSYNAGKLIHVAASSDMGALGTLKEKLSRLQEQVLSAGGETNTVTARNGATITDQQPKKKLKPSRAERHNNPGNIKYAGWLAKKYGAVKGEQSSDGDYFARFPDSQTGLKAMKGLLKGPGYKNLSVQKALQRWTNSEGYNIDLKDLKDRNVGTLNDTDLRRVMDIITRGEDSRLYDLDSLFSIRRDDPGIDIAIKPPALKPLQLRDGPGTYVNTPPDAGTPTAPPAGAPPIPEINVPGTPVRKGRRNPLAFSQVAPELLALGDRADFTPGQRYEPSLYQPYQVSFQDRLNENQATFNRVATQTGNNPAAISMLAAQKYTADSAALADEFRTNQGITNEVTNKNIALLNDAQLKNLQLADTQFVRQSQAVANTRQNIYNAISSLSSKLGQSRLETRSYNAMSSLFPQYDFDNEGNSQFIPNEQMSFGAYGTSSDNDSYYQRTREEFDGRGKLRKKIINTPSDAEQTRLDYQNWNNQLKKRMSVMDQVRKLKSTS